MITSSYKILKVLKLHCDIDICKTRPQAMVDPPWGPLVVHSLKPKLKLVKLTLCISWIIKTEVFEAPGCLGLQMFCLGLIDTNYKNKFHYNSSRKKMPTVLLLLEDMLLEVGHLYAKISGSSLSACSISIRDKTAISWDPGQGLQYTTYSQMPLTNASQHIQIQKTITTKVK